MTLTTTEPPATGSEPAGEGGQPAAGTGQRPPSGGHVLVRFAHAVEDALDRVEDASCLSMSEGEAADAVLALSRAQARIAELRLRTLAQADARDVARQDASASTGAWLAHRTRQTRGGACGDVRLATALAGEFQATRAALAAGVVVEEQARVIVRAVRALGPGVSEQTRRAGERFLLERAQEFDAAALAVMGRHLFEVLDPEEADRRLGRKLAEEARAAARKTFLQLHDNGDGTSSGRFKIPALTASQLLKMLEAILAPRHQRAARKADGGRVMHPDRHPLGADDWQRRHDAGEDGEDGEAAEKADAERERRLLTRPERLGQALCALVERFPADRLPQLGGLNATVVVTMTLEQLRGELEGACLVDTGEQVSAGAARRLACEAGIIPAVLGSDSEVLDLGRVVRLHTGPQRIALGLRDRGCTAEGCTRPAYLTEAHHKIPWSQGGPTSVQDGVLLCPWHHHRAHDPHHTVEYLPTGTTRFHRRT